MSCLQRVNGLITSSTYMYMICIFILYVLEKHNFEYSVPSTYIVSKNIFYNNETL